MATVDAPETPRELQVAYFELLERLERVEETLDGMRAGKRKSEPPRRKAANADPRSEPRWLRRNVRWAGGCASCGIEIPAGPVTSEPIYYVPGTNGDKSQMHHGHCAVSAGLTTHWPV